MKPPLGWAQHPAPSWWGRGICGRGCSQLAELMDLSFCLGSAGQNQPLLPPWEPAPELWLHHFCAWGTSARALGCEGVSLQSAAGPSSSWVKGLGVARGRLCFWCPSGPWHPLHVIVPQIGLPAQSAPRAAPRSQLCALSQHPTASARPLAPWLFTQVCPPPLDPCYLSS